MLTDQKGNKGGERHSENRAHFCKNLKKELAHLHKSKDELGKDAIVNRAVNCKYYGFRVPKSCTKIVLIAHSSKGYELPLVANSLQHFRKRCKAKILHYILEILNNSKKPSYDLEISSKSPPYTRCLKILTKSCLKCVDQVQFRPRMILVGKISYASFP